MPRTTLRGCVVSDDNALQGIVTHDDAMDILRQEPAGRHRKVSASTPAGEYLKMLAWVTSHGYEATLMNLLILALYMPMVAHTGGNTGSQSATVVVQALALGITGLLTLLHHRQVDLGDLAKHCGLRIVSGSQFKRRRLRSVGGRGWESCPRRRGSLDVEFSPKARALQCRGFFCAGACSDPPAMVHLAPHVPVF
ncbi:MAG: hypothetical protein LLG01_08920 [Planctomycetaceae bacterium]|nr:hypothetical protein [Planctomycetaceae bacterium]